MGRRQLCTYMYDVKSSSGVVTVVHGVRFYVPFPSVYNRRSAVEELRGGVQSVGLMLTRCNINSMLPYSQRNYDI